MSELVIDGYLIDAPIEEILTKVKSQLTNGKLRYFKVKGNEVKVTCPHHGDGQEKNPDCYIVNEKDDKLEYGTCHCFACGFSGRLSKFVGECFDEDEKFGEKWLVDNYGSLTEGIKGLLYDYSCFDDDIKPKEILDESILDTYQKWHPYLDKRHISRQVCEKFKLRYDPETECIVFPVWDEDDNLVMFTKRSVNTKMFVIDEDKEKPIYLYNVIKRNNIQEVTIVESQFNCLTLWSWNIPAVALFGTGDPYQYEILNNSNIKHYYLAFDGDSAGDKGLRRFLKNIRRDVFVDIILIPRGKDVNDLTEEEFNSLQIIDSQEWLRNNS